MTLMNIRLELGRTTGFPNGDSSHGYEFLAPLTEEGHIDHDLLVQWNRGLSGQTVSAPPPRRARLSAPCGPGMVF